MNYRELATVGCLAAKRSLLVYFIHARAAVGSCKSSRRLREVVKARACV